MRSLVRRTLRAAPFALLPCLGCASALPEATRDAERTFVTTIDMLESGQRGVDAFLARDPAGPRLRQAIERGSRAVTRILLTTPTGSGGFSLRNGSGVLLSGGRLVLSAAHVVDEQERAELSVVLPDGRTTPARVVALGDGDGDSDWAILELDEPRAGAPALSAVGEAVVGELVFALGYPGHAGIAPAGYVVNRDGAERQVLSPIVSIGRVLDVAPLSLELVAGTEIMGGMSGGPVCDAEGRVLGILTASTFRVDPAGEGGDGGDAGYAISATSTRAFEVELRGLWPAAATER